MNYFRNVKDLIVRFWRWILSWFENHQYLYVSHNQYNSEGEIIDVLEKKFEVRKFYKQTQKHMKFKTMEGHCLLYTSPSPRDS